MTRREPSLDRLVSALVGHPLWPGSGGSGRGRTEILLPISGSDSQRFRETMGVFPSPVSVVTALDQQGLPRGLTCSAVCSLSMAPPSMLICVNRRNRSLDAIRHSGGFVINLLRSGTDDLSKLFASASAAKFETTRWRPSRASGLPVLEREALAVVDCRLLTEVIAGSHVICVGLVRDAISFAHQDGPLVYWQRRYGRWADPGPSAASPSPQAAV